MPQSLRSKIEVRFELKPGWIEGKSHATILSALGHPGYGETFAQRVLERVMETGLSVHEVVYGGRRSA